MTSMFNQIKQILKKNIKLHKRYGFNNILKRVLSITVIVLSILTTQFNTNTITTYANEAKEVSAYTLMYTDYSKNFNRDSINNVLLKSKVLDWSEANTLIKKGETFKILDPNTGTVINLKRTGGSNHMDVETLTKADTDKLKMVWGGFSWEKKGMLLIKSNGTSYIVSVHGMPHAGIDNKPGGTTVSYRSQNFGKGTNWDFVKDNQMNGHICIHFKGSKTHGSKKVVYKHQYEIEKLKQSRDKLYKSFIKEF